ncbi:ribosome-associated translation inhibitor RaiA [bacterium]|nr:ribosome-associated translation inhibitor RaiA [bacterium]
MKIRITSRHQKLAPKLREYIEEKLDRVERYYDRIIDCEVVIVKEKIAEKVEISIKVYGKSLNVKAKDPDLTKAIDLCMDKLEVQLKKFKGKMKSRPHVRISEVLAGTAEE